MAITKSKALIKRLIDLESIKVDALLESLFIQFHSQCLKQHLIDDRAILLMVRKLRQMPIDIHLYGKSIQNHETKNE